jgi:hypothetical protein
MAASRLLRQTGRFDETMAVLDDPYAAERDLCSGVRRHAQ